MKELNKLLFIFLGGGLGASLRYLISAAIQTPPSGFPISTLVINTAGCFIIGMIYPILNIGNETLKLFVVIGLIGGFTTFSAFGNETFQLLSKGQNQTALIYVILSNICGLIAVYLGNKISSIL